MTYVRDKCYRPRTLAIAISYCLAVIRVCCHDAESTQGIEQSLRPKCASRSIHGEGGDEQEDGGGTLDAFVSMISSASRKTTLSMLSCSQENDGANGEASCVKAWPWINPASRDKT